MTASTIIHDDSLDRYARVTGVAMLLSLIFGYLGEMYFPGRIIVAGNAMAAHLDAEAFRQSVAAAAFFEGAPTFCFCRSCGLSVEDGCLPRRLTQPPSPSRVSFAVLPHQVDHLF